MPESTRINKMQQLSKYVEWIAYKLRGVVNLNPILKINRWSELEKQPLT